MRNINKANRCCCDVSINDYLTGKPIMWADFCNTTTSAITSSKFYVNKKSTRCMSFDYGIQGTLTMEFQIHPFCVYSLLSDGIIENDAIAKTRKTIECTKSGVLYLSLDDNIMDGTVFVFDAEDFCGEEIYGEYDSENNRFEAQNESDLVVGREYEVGYVQLLESDVKRISINDKRLPRDYSITMKTIEKDENGQYTTFFMNYYRCSIQRNLDLTFASIGEPMTITLTFEVFPNENGDFIDFVEFDEEKYKKILESIRFAKKALVYPKSTAKDNSFGDETAILSTKYDNFTAQNDVLIWNIQ